MSTARVDSSDFSGLCFASPACPGGARCHMSTIQEIPEQERPRERLARLGPSSLTEAELLAILLRVGVRGASAVTLGAQLLKKFGGLPGIARASVDDLAAHKGVGAAKAVQIKAAFEIALRMSRQMEPEVYLREPQDVFNYLGQEMGQLNTEHMRVLMVNTRMRLLHVEEISRGILNEVTVHAREVLAPVITRRAWGFFIAHNHPSGDPAPSDADTAFTRQLAAGARLLDLRFLDHVIIGRPTPSHPEGYFSFVAAGLLG